LIVNLPNALTISRIFLAPLLVVLLLTGGRSSRETWAFVVFVAASLTDYLDGYLARKRFQVTTLGKLLDPIADKLLVSAAFISLVQMGIAPAWMVVIVIGREFAVTGLRSIASAEGFTIAASRLGKYKMATQVACASFLILGGHYPGTFLYKTGRALLWLVVFLAIVSMIQYFRRFWSQIDEGIKNRRRQENRRRIPFLKRYRRKSDVTINT
jgi:CDP-diacylglycerol---glycerol-3-phosphate 3-phosphatidyltransferase